MLKRADGDYCRLYFDGEPQIGEIRFLSRARVLQVLGERRYLVQTKLNGRDMTLLVSGDAKGLVDDAMLPIRPFYVGGTATYTTVAGGTKTVFSFITMDETTLKNALAND